MKAQLIGCLVCIYACVVKNNQEAGWNIIGVKRFCFWRLTVLGKLVPHYILMWTTTIHIFICAYDIYIPLYNFNSIQFYLTLYLFVHSVMNLLYQPYVKVAEKSSCLSNIYPKPFSFSYLNTFVQVSIFPSFQTVHVFM